MNAAEFFAGIGLVRMGLERAGWSISFANDICPRKRSMYEGHFGADGRFVTADIHSLNPDAIPPVVLATASFPCTDLSVAGLRRGLHAGQSSAFWGFHRLIDRMKHRRPHLILLENVTGFLTSRHGKDFEDAMVALSTLGYSVDPFILDAKWFTPQSRLRLFVVASRIADDQMSRDMETLAETRTRPAALISFIRKHPDISWAIRTLPDPPKRSSLLLPDIVEDVPHDAPEWWSGERTDSLYRQMSERHRTVADTMKANRRWSYGTVFRRTRNGRSMAELRTDGIAGCLRTPKGGSGRQILFRAGFGRHMARFLTPAECATLMGADGFRIRAPFNQALFGFGDAVCAPVVQWIAENYLNPLITFRQPKKSLALCVPSCDHFPLYDPRPRSLPKAIDPPPRRI